MGGRLRPYGVHTIKELHATDWLGSRGRVAPSNHPKGARAHIFQYVLSSIALMLGVQILNAHAHNMKVCGSTAMIISDEKKLRSPATKDAVYKPYTKLSLSLRQRGQH